MKQKVLQKQFFLEIINSKSNFKMFCRMKKNVYSLLMMLALVVLAGTNAFAQTDGDLPTQPIVHLPGSTHAITITPGVGTSTFSWQLYAGTNATTPVSEALVDRPTTIDWPLTTEDISLVWTDLASGSYYLEVTETDNDPTCAVTKRGVHLYILNFDARVYASNISGTEITTLTSPALASCGESSNYPVFMNDETKTLSGANRADGTVTTADGNIGDFIGSGPRTNRYFSVEITFSAVPAGFNFLAPDLKSVVCDIATTATSDLYSVNNVDVTPSSLTGQLVPENTTSNIFTFPAVFNARWGTDIDVYSIVTNIKLHGETNASDTALGEEAVSLEDTDKSNGSAENNISETFKIQASPNTSKITVN